MQARPGVFARPGINDLTREKISEIRTLQYIFKYMASLWPRGLEPTGLSPCGDEPTF